MSTEQHALRKGPTDHVVSDATDGGAFKCLHCGARMKLEFPVAMTDFLDAGKAFAERHTSCKPASSQVPDDDASAKLEGVQR